MSRHHRAALVLAAALLAACSDAHTPTAAPSAAPVAQRASQSGKVDLALVTQQLAQLDRIGEHRAGARAAIDSLEQLWQASGGATRGTTSALLCKPRKYDADVQVIGPEGGELRAGKHTLSIPEGALRSPTVITMEAPVSLAVTVRLQPHGLTFDVPPTLTLDYKQCVASDDPAVSVAYVDDALTVLERPRSKREKKGVVSAVIWHFSDYIVAY
jgi:hypothetical protein